MNEEASAPLRVVLFGYSYMLITSLDAIVGSEGHRVVGVVTTPGTRRRQSNDYVRIVEHFGSRADVIVSSHPRRWASMLAPMRSDLIVCMGFPWKIPPEVLEIPRLGAINAHPSLLPKYRGAGANVFGWLFRNDEHEGGVTVHRMDGEFDTGAILAQERFPVTDDDDFESLMPKIGRAGAPALRRGLAAAAGGEQGTPQAPGEGFYVDWFEPEWRYIDWSRPAREVHNKVRSWVGFEIPRGAIGEIEGVQTNVIKTRLLDIEATASAAPGTILRREGATLIVQCGDGPLEVLRWEPLPPTE